MIKSVGLQSLVLLFTVLYARSSTAVPVFAEDYYEALQHHDSHQHHHAAVPPATSYATISTTHVKVQHPAAAAPAKYATPYKYEYLTQPQTAYKYISLPSAAVALQSSKYEEPSTPSYKYLAASPTYKYVQPPAVTTEPEAAEVPTNALKNAFKYEQNAFKLQQQQEQQQDYEQPAVQYKYVAVPSYKFVQQAAAAPEYGQLQQQLSHAPAPVSSYDYTDDKQQY